METTESVIGIDEAGRGPTLGPLVIGMVRWNNPDVPDDLKLRDSKKMSKQQRNNSYQYIVEQCEHRILTIPAWVISRQPESLPMIEARVINGALRHLDGSSVYCDRLSAGETIHEHVREQHPNRSFVFETGADDNYTAVSAASILAKVARDQIMNVHSKDWGELGSGYPSDPSTRSWMEDWYERQRSWPSFVRTNWGTVKSIEQAANQGELFESTTAT